MGDKHVLMFSGGLDSYLALLTLLDNQITPTLVFVRHGNQNEFEQLHSAKVLANRHGLKLVEDFTLQGLGNWEKEDFFIPNRNMFLAMVGALYGDHIWFAIMDGEQTYDDCKLNTFTAISIALTLSSGTPVTIHSPFWDMTKAEAIANLKSSHYDNLKKTWSCHNGGNKHCGHCTACFRRFIAFELNGIKDEWIVNPWTTGTTEQYLEKARNNYYGGKRDEEIIQVLEKYQ